MFTFSSKLHTSIAILGIYNPDPFLALRAFDLESKDSLDLVDQGLTISLQGFLNFVEDGLTLELAVVYSTEEKTNITKTFFRYLLHTNLDKTSAKHTFLWLGYVNRASYSNSYKSLIAKTNGQVRIC